MAARRKKSAKKSRDKVKKTKAPKEPKEIKPGPPFESVMLVVTGLMLIVALVTLDFVKGRDYGEGLMFSGEYGAAE